MKQIFGKETVYIRSGGSIPIVGVFDRYLGIPSVMMGFGLPDDNLHAPNEKFHLPNFYPRHRGGGAVSGDSGRVARPLWKFGRVLRQPLAHARGSEGAATVRERCDRAATRRESHP